MKRMKHVGMMLVMAAMMSSCVTSWFTSLSKQSQAIEPGMTKQEVINILGNSQYRSFDGRYEQWEYRCAAGGNDWEVVRIEFTDGRVARMESFREIYHPFPEKPKNTKE